MDALALLETDAAVDMRYVSSPDRIAYRVFGGNKLAFTVAAAKEAVLGAYRHVIVDHVNIAAAIAPLARLKLCDYAVWLCGVEVFPPKPDREGDLGLRNARIQLAISEYTRQRVLERYPGLPVAVCDLALDPVRHASASKPSDAEYGQPVVLRAASGVEKTLSGEVILHVGRMAANEQYKGQDTLIQAFALVRREHSAAQLVFAGTGDDLERLKELANHLPSEDQDAVFFAGRVDDRQLTRLYRASHAFAMPSSGEGFGLVYLEAMSHAKACLASKADASKYVVRDGVTGLLVDDPRSSEEVARVLNWMLSNPDRVRQMGQNGQALVRSYYESTHFARRFLAALGEA